MSATSSKKSKQKRWRRKRAHMRLRTRVRGTAERPRLAVFKSLKHIYAQVIDDERGATLVAASSLDGEVRDRLAADSASGSSRAAARLVGEIVAERAKSKGVESVIFDRGGYIYHGKVKDVAEAARGNGLTF